MPRYLVIRLRLPFFGNGMILFVVHCQGGSAPLRISLHVLRTIFRIKSPPCLRSSFVTMSFTPWGFVVFEVSSRVLYFSSVNVLVYFGRVLEEPKDPTLHVLLSARRSRDLLADNKTNCCERTILPQQSVLLSAIACAVHELSQPSASLRTTFRGVLYGLFCGIQSIL